MPRWLRQPLFAICAAGTLCLAYAWLVEPCWIEVTHTEIALAKMPPGSRLRVALVSDLHLEGPGFRVEAVPRMVALEHPDVVVFAGDVAASERALPAAQKLLGDLAAPGGVLAVRGDADLRFPGDGLFPANVTLLQRGGRTMSKDGVAVSFCGRDFGAEVGGCPRGAGVRVLVAHDPGVAARAKAAGFDLLLAGHTHGGQVALPFFGAAFAPEHYDPRFERGLGDYEGMKVFVSRGLGLWPGAPPLRFGRRPEVAILDLVPAK